MNKGIPNTSVSIAMNVFALSLCSKQQRLDYASQGLNTTTTTYECCLWLNG